MCRWGRSDKRKGIDPYYVMDDSDISSFSVEVERRLLQQPQYNIDSSYSFSSSSIDSLFDDDRDPELESSIAEPSLQDDTGRSRGGVVKRIINVSKNGGSGWGRRSSRQSPPIDMGRRDNHHMCCQTRWKGHVTGAGAGGGGSSSSSGVSSGEGPDSDDVGSIVDVDDISALYCPCEDCRYALCHMGQFPTRLQAAARIYTVIPPPTSIPNDESYPQTMSHNSPMVLYSASKISGSSYRHRKKSTPQFSSQRSSVSASSCSSSSCSLSKGSVIEGQADLDVNDDKESSANDESYITEEAVNRGTKTNLSSGGGYASAYDSHSGHSSSLQETAAKVSVLLGQFPKITIGDALR